MNSLDNSKLIRLLYSLTDAEFKELGLWVDSPVHNSSEKTKKLYLAIKNRKNKTISLLYLLKKIGLLQKGTLKKEITTKNIQDLRKIASNLTLQIEQYLIWKQNSKASIKNNRVLMDQLISRQLLDLTQLVFNKSKKSLLANPLRDIEFCKNQYELDEIQFYLDLFNKNRTASDSLKQAIKSLQYSCLSQLLRYYGAMANSKNIFSGEEELQFMNIVKDYLANTKNIDHFTIEIYFKQLVLLENGKTDDYFRFKNLLFSSFSSFDANELRQFFGFMSNFCLEMIFNGHNEFLHERLEIYKQGLDLDCWTAGIYFSRHQFINIVKTGLDANEMEWVNEFIKVYGIKLAPSIQQNTLHLCKAMVAFEESAYDEAQQLLFMISRSEDFVHHSLMEVLQIKIFYQNEKLTFENFNIHPIHARMKAFNAYLNIASGKKLSNSRQAIYFNFLQILKQIIQIRKKLFSDAGLNTTANKKLHHAIENLQENCTTLTPLRERAWLLQQIKLLGLNQQH